MNGGDCHSDRDLTIAVAFFIGLMLVFANSAERNGNPKLEVADGILRAVFIRRAALESGQIHDSRDGVRVDCRHSAQPESRSVSNGGCICRAHRPIHWKTRAQADQHHQGKGLQLTDALQRLVQSREYRCAGYQYHRGEFSGEWWEGEVDWQDRIDRCGHCEIHMETQTA